MYTRIFVLNLFLNSSFSKVLSPYQCSKEIDQRCAPDLSGYYWCPWRSWPNPQLKETCRNGNICKCVTNEYQKICRCVNPEVPAPFPRTGRITWNGLEEIEQYEYNRKTRKGGMVKKVYKIYGEIYKDKFGNFLKIWNNGRNNISEFEIILPDYDGTFIKYQGFSTSKSCKNFITQNSGSLSNVWESKEKYWLQKSQQVGKVTEQTWKSFGIDIEKYLRWISFDESSLSYELIVIVDPIRGIVTPKTYTRRIEDGFAEYFRIMKLQYKYENVHNENATLKLEDYCKK